MKRVLVVEDEEDVAELVASVLDLEGFETRTASGPLAMAEALAFRPDIVLLDLMMPVVDGFDVARQLQAHAATRAVPIVVMTAMHDPGARAAEVGTAHDLAKPFDLVDLIETVSQVASG